MGRPSRGILRRGGVLQLLSREEPGRLRGRGRRVTSRPELADEIRSLANHGRSHGHSHYDHDRIGTNSRLDALQAILLSGKLAHLEEWTERRIALASRYREQLGGRRVRRHRTETDSYRAVGTTDTRLLAVSCATSGLVQGGRLLRAEPGLGPDRPGGVLARPLLE